MSNKNTMTAYVRDEDRPLWVKIIDGIFDFLGHLLLIAGAVFFLGMSLVIGLPSFVNALETVQNGDSVTFLQATNFGFAIVIFEIGRDLAKRLRFKSSQE